MEDTHPSRRPLQLRERAQVVHQFILCNYYTCILAYVTVISLASARQGQAIADASITVHSHTSVACGAHHSLRSLSSARALQSYYQCVIL
jgi:hypothetical protein